MINQKNTFVSTVEQVALLNKNAVEIMTKFNKVVSSNDSVVNITLTNSDGTESIFQFPTVGQLKREIGIINENVKRLSGLGQSSAYISDGKTNRKIYVDDLNREPASIDTIDVVNNFTSINNSFFESLSNPMLAVKINLTDKVQHNVKKVLSRRYIIKFQKDNNGDLTTYGYESKSDFDSNFLNRNDISIDDFISWYFDQKNVGIIRTNEPYDEQVFDMDYEKLMYHGVFNVIGVDNDTLNKKMWYILNDLSYRDYLGNNRYLVIGDELIMNTQNSSSKWKVKEISTSKSVNRVILDRIEGIDAVPIIDNGLKIYSSTVSDKSIKISIGYDECNVIFVKPINVDSNIIASNWSLGTSFYSNDLVLDINNNISMTRYYSESVFDYGAALKDLVVKNIPSKYGVKPNEPFLTGENIKVVQINKHLTDSANIKTIRELHATKNSLKSRLEQLNEAIIEKNKELSTKKYKSESDKKTSQTELDRLILDQTSTNKLYTSIINRIASESSGGISEENPKFRIRGFWSFPEPIVVNSAGQKQTQEVVQFKVQYRYSAKGGSEPTTEGFELNLTESFYNNLKNSNDIIDSSSYYSNIGITTKDTNVTGYFSNWNQYLTDARRRVYDKVNDTWKWELEDVSDANTPNINQLDIPIQKNEKVEIRVKSISEVGWPNAPLESDWSDIIVIDFPDELLLNSDNSLILQDAKNEQIYSQIENNFNSKGLNSHLQQSYYVNDLYVAHTDDNLLTSFKDNSGNSIMLSDYLKYLTDKISSLEEAIAKAKGELVVKLFKNSSETVIENGAVVNINVKCEDYAEAYGTEYRTYYNSIYVIEDYYLQFENVSKSSQTGLLSYRKYIPDINNSNSFYNNTQNDNSLASYVDSDNNLKVQKNNQFIWISDTSGGKPIYQYPSSGSATDLKKVLYSKYRNVGLSTSGNSINVVSDIVWSGATWSSDNDYQVDFPVTVHPYIENINNFIYSDKGGVKLMNPSSKIILPIRIFFKLSNDGANKVSFPSNLNTSPYVTRKLRLFLETDDNSKWPFEFEIVFKINRNKTTVTRTLN